MRLRLGLMALGCLAIAGHARAQVPPPAPFTSAPLPPPPGGTASPNGSVPSPQTDQTAPSQQPQQPNVWQPQGTAELQALDKVDARSATLTIKAGQSAQYGSLTIALQACVVRPQDQPADAAAFLTITDSHADQPGFRGWMLRSDPSLAMLQHPLYDVRVLGCRP